MQTVPSKVEEMEGLELCRAAMSEGRRGLVEAWLRVEKLELGGGLVTFSSDQSSFWFLYRSMSPRFKCAKNSKFKYKKGTVHLKTFVKRSEKFLLNRSD